MEPPSHKRGDHAIDQIALSLVEDHAEHVHERVLSALLQTHPMRLVGSSNLDSPTGTPKLPSEHIEIGASLRGMIDFKRLQAHTQITPCLADGDYACQHM